MHTILLLAVIFAGILPIANAAFPTKPPTKSPTSRPTISLPPTMRPTPSPTVSPTFAPTCMPSGHPTATPSAFPSASPVASPTAQLSGGAIAGISIIILMLNHYHMLLIKTFRYRHCSPSSSWRWSILLSN